MGVYFDILVRTLFMYAAIIVIFRIMGKREIGELSILDLVVFIMIAEMAVISIESPQDPIMHTMFPMMILLAIQISMALLSLKSRKFREMLDGKPTVIINNGEIDENAMHKQRYNFTDLMTQLREKNVKNVADVEFAILEPSGKLSVFEKGREKATLNLPLIEDGFINEEHLKLIDKTNLWLRQELRRLGYPDIKDISFCSYDNKTFHIDLKNKK